MRSWERFGGAAAVLGGVLAAIFNVLHAGPRRGSTRLFLEDLAGSRIWELDQVGIAVSLLVVLAALVAMARVIGGPWAAAAGACGVAGVAVALANVAVDGPAMLEIAERWAAAEGSRKEALFAAAEALRAVDIALFSVWTVALVGATPLLFGAAILVGRAAPAWLGWLAVGGGLVGAGTGAAQMFTGLKPVTVFVLFPLASGTLTLWLVGMGVVLWRRHAVDSAQRRHMS